MPTLPQLSPPIIRSVNAILSSIQSPPLYLLKIVLTQFFVLFNLNQNLINNARSKISTPRKITAPPIILVIFTAFRILNFEIIFSVGNGRIMSIIPRITQLASATVRPTSLANESIKSPIGIPNTQIILITANSLPKRSPFS